MTSTETSTRGGIVRRGYEAFQNGDKDPMRTILAGEVAWHGHGQGAKSGDFRGVKNVIGSSAGSSSGAAEASASRINEILEGEHSVVVLARSTASRGKRDARSALRAHPPPPRRSGV
jgi:ketosteroid isomerase-like protein